MTPSVCSRQNSASRSPRSTTKAFSLIELLVVVAIAAIMASIMVPMIGRLGDSGDQVRHRRNAQSIATTYMAGQTAGAHFLVPGSLDDTIRNVVAGAMIQNGVFAGDVFAVPGLSDADQEEAARYLMLEGDRVSYVPEA